MFRKYKGCVGCIRDIASVEDKPFFATVGLDRFLRVYDISSKRPVQKVYLKSRLNGVLLRPDFDPFVEEKERQEEAERLANEDRDSDVEEIFMEEEKDSMWSNMEEVGEGDKEETNVKKRKNVTIPENETPRKKKGKKKLKKKVQS